MSRITVPTTLLLCVVLASAAAAQTTIRVPADQPTIQAAINAAAPGDTVLVAPGTYFERIDFSGKAIVVTSEAGPAATTINGSAAGVVVTFDSGEGPGAVLRGVTVTNGSGFTGGGVRVSNASPTLENNVITANTGCSGIGINVNFGSPSIVGNRITNNVQSGCFGGGGAGIEISGAGAAVIDGNVISGNVLISGSGGGMSLFAAGDPVIRNNEISGNSASGISPAAQGGGIAIFNVSDALIVQNLIVGNSAGEGGGVYWLVPSGAPGPRLVNNTIAGNLATVAGDGSAVFADGFDVNAVLVNNLLIGANGQTALHCGDFNDASPPIIRFNDVFSLGSPAYGGLCADQTGINGNVSVAPAFVNPALTDYRLQVGSPVVDAGDGTAADVPATDIEGAARVVDGNGDTVAVVDMGAYERPSGGLPFFADVPPSYWARFWIETLFGAGVTGGCSVTPPLYCPESMVTREQMAAFIIRALGEFDPPAPATQRFLDVPPSSPFYRFIDRMAVLGITGGCGGGNYCPGAPVTREQMAAFIVRALGEFAPPQPAAQRFLDVPPSNPFYAFIDRMAVLGITAGCTTTSYCPLAAVTRAQMAVFLVRAFNLDF
jgi:parallel beta-helix repeat protein